MKIVNKFLRPRGTPPTIIFHRSLIFYTDHKFHLLHEGRHCQVSCNKARYFPPRRITIFHFSNFNPNCLVGLSGGVCLFVFRKSFLFAVRCSLFCRLFGTLLLMVWPFGIFVSPQNKYFLLKRAFQIRNGP